MKSIAFVSLALLVATLAIAKEPYRDYLPGLPAAPIRQLETDEEVLSQPHDEEAHFFAKVSTENYIAALRAASRGSRPHLIKLFNSASHQDGAGAEGFASTLFWLLHRVGDETFASVLARQSPRVRRRVIDLLDFGAEYDYSSAFPKTFRLAKHGPA